jgi:hypothetical protein
VALRAGSGGVLVQPGRRELCPSAGLTSPCGEPETVLSVLEDVQGVTHAVSGESGREPVGVLRRDIAVLGGVPDEEGRGRELA